MLIDQASNTNLKEKEIHMAEYTKTGSIMLFKNSNKKEAKHPDYQGTLTMDGIEHKVSGWTKTDKNGNPFISAQTSIQDGANDSAEASTTEATPASNPDQMELF